MVTEVSNNNEYILLNFWRAGRGPRNNRLDFGGDPSPDPEFLNDPAPWILKDSLYLLWRFL